MSTTNTADCSCCYWLVKVCHILYKLREGFKYCSAEYIFEEKVLQKKTTKNVCPVFGEKSDGNRGNPPPPTFRGFVPALGPVFQTFLYSGLHVLTQSHTGLPMLYQRRIREEDGEDKDSLKEEPKPHK